VVVVDSANAGGFGVFAATTLSQPAPVRVECYVETDAVTVGTTGMGKVLLRTYGSAPTVVDVDEFVDLSQPISLFLHVDETDKTVSCRRGGSSKPFAETSLQDVGPWHPGIEAGDAVRFRYFDVIQR
jgi:hypothetical protein